MQESYRKGRIQDARRSAGRRWFEKVNQDNVGVDGVPLGWRTRDRLLVFALPVAAALLVVGTLLLGASDALEVTPIPPVLFLGMLYVVCRLVAEANHARRRLRMRRFARDN
jgi:hypothetical protein